MALMLLLITGTALEAVVFSALACAIDAMSERIISRMR